VRKHRPAKLLMVGDGPDRAPAERLAKELGVQTDVYFLGSQPEVIEILAEADVLLQPSEMESFGLTALEASAACTPAVASKVGGLPEVIIEGETGFLLPLGDVEGMAGKVLELLADRSIYMQFARAGRERALKLFNVQRILNMYLEVYDRTLKG
jgi:glycosyltransferase involved in cell wall biosynthesis